MAPDELAFIDAGRTVKPPPQPVNWRAALVNRDILILAASYFCLNFVFYIFSQWLFTYLVKSRGLSMLESGWLYVLPFATGAVLTAIGGGVCDSLCRRLGGLRGCRITAMSGLVVVAITLGCRPLCDGSLRRGGPALALLRLHAFRRHLLLGRDDLCLGRAHGERGRHAELRRHDAGPAGAAHRVS
jgi:nitrate/nitrite transporter NarK